MRTTITLPDELVEKAKTATGKQRVSEAVAESLADYFRLKNRLALLDDLFDEPVPHRMSRIKQDRSRRKWSA